MNHKVHNQLVNFIWSIADDVLRDVFVRGRYRDIILPFTVLRRLDNLLVPTKEKVFEAFALSGNRGLAINPGLPQFPKKRTKYGMVAIAGQT